MCAPDHGKMNAISIQRIGSQSSGQATLVGDDLSPVSPIDGFWPANDGSLEKRPIVHTVDSTPWIRLDALHPKLVQELRRGYSIPEWDQKRSRSNGATKVKAWFRQSSVGVVLRLRQKINENHDEVIDAELSPVLGKSDLPSKTFTRHVVASDEVMRETAQLLPNTNGVSVELPDNFVCELPETGLVEAPDTQAAVELSADIQRRGSARSDHIWNTDPVPQYEENGTGQLAPDPHRSHSQSHVWTDWKHEATPILLDCSTWERSQAETLDIEERSVHDAGNDTKVSDRHHQDKFTSEHLRPEELSPVVVQAEAKLDAARQQEQRAKEASISLATFLKQKVDDQQRESSESYDHLPRFRIVSQTRYETETDADPPASRDRLDVPSLRLKTSFARLGRRKRAANSRCKMQRIGLTSSDEESGKDSADEKILSSARKSGPQVTPASAGREAVLTALLRGQTELLGRGHSVTCKARQMRPRNGQEWSQRRITRMTVNFRKGEALAKDTLGEDHPHVKVFSSDLTTFIELMSQDDSERVGELKNQLDEQPSSQASSPITPGTKSEEDQSQQKNFDSIKGSPGKVDAEAKVSPPVALDSIPEHTEKSDDGTLAPDATPVYTDTLTENEIAGTVSGPYRARPRVVIFTGLVIAAISKLMISIFQWLQIYFGPEPALESGKYRVRWTCSCGEDLYEDYTELVPGAARRLEALLNRTRPHNNTTHTHTHTHTHSNASDGNSGSSLVDGGDSSTNTTPMSSANSSPTSHASSHTTWSSASHPSPFTPSPLKSLSSSPAPAVTPRWLPSFRPQSDPPYLLICTSEDAYTTRMHHLDVAPEYITSDMALGRALRTHYSHVSRRSRGWWRKLRLRGVAGIDFVQFEVHANRFADIRKCPDVPPPTAPGTRGEYAFEVPDTLPPVGSKLLLHLFRHPEDYDRELVAYLRIPKRTAGRLPRGVGWGLNLVEDFLPERVAVAVGSLVFLASVVFGIAWACARHDVQGAFGVAQWITSAAVFACGWVQLYVG